MVPSSFIISTNAPPGFNPANLVRSTTASVCPALRITPFCFALSGKICPGRPKSSGFVFGSTRAFIVFALSDADIPVVHPCPIRSTETVNGVACRAVLLSTINSRSNSSHRSSGNGAHINPLP